MARIRSVKPEFWDDRKLAKRTSRDSRLLYIALWNLADEHGRLNGDPYWIKGQVFPYEDDLDAQAVEKLLSELAADEVGAVVQYEADGDPYLFLPKLAKHQRLEPDKVASRLPAPPDPDEVPPGSELAHPVREADKSEPEGYQPESRAHESARRAYESAQRAGKPALLYGAGGMEHAAGSRGDARGPDPAERGSPPTPPSASGGLHEIPDDFAPTEAMLRWANNTYPGLDLDFETDQFRRHWRAEGKRKKSWADAWQKWIGDSHKRMNASSRASPAAPRPSTADQRRADGNALKAKIAARRQDHS